MTEPTPPPSPVPPPFSPPSTTSPFDRPPGAPRGATGPGVGKPLLIGCGVIFVLMLIAGVVFVAQQNKIAAWLFELMESQLAPLVPEDLPTDVRQRYEVAFDDAIEAFREGDYDPFAMQGAQQEFSRVMRDVAEKGQGGRMSREDVERLAAALEKIAGRGAETGDEESGPPVDEVRRGRDPGADRRAGRGAGNMARAPSRSA